MVLAVKKQIHHTQRTQIAPAPRVEILIELLRDPTDRAFTHAATTEGVAVEGAHVLRGQPPDVHAPHQALEIRRPRLKTVRQVRPKRLLGATQLGHRQFQRPRLALHLFWFIAIAPADALALTPSIVFPAKKRCRFRFDGDLQHVPREPTHEARHRRLLRRRRGRRALQQTVDLFLQLHARWYSLHGVDLLRPRFNGAALVWSPGGYQRLFAFTGSLGHHLWEIPGSSQPGCSCEARPRGSSPCPAFRCSKYLGYRF